jgi:hypothetical protein
VDAAVAVTITVPVVTTDVTVAVPPPTVLVAVAVEVTEFAPDDCVAWVELDVWTVVVADVVLDC